MDELKALRTLARAMGVHTRYRDGLGKRVVVAPETLLRVCATLGARTERLSDVPDALRAHRAAKHSAHVPPVLVAWDGILPGGVTVVDSPAQGPLSIGYHHVTVEIGGKTGGCTVIAAPVESWHRPGSHRSWGVGTHLAALRSSFPVDPTQARANEKGPGQSFVMAVRSL